MTEEGTSKTLEDPSVWEDTVSVLVFVTTINYRN